MSACSHAYESWWQIAPRSRGGSKRASTYSSHPLGNGQVAAIGYCFGGRTVLELTRTGAQLAGAISVHGSLESARPPRAGNIKAKVLVCHGALDPHVPTTQLTKFIEEMNAAGTDYQLIVYGGAMHGFTHDVGPQTPGVAYHPLADQRSFLAIKTFLAEIFGMPMTASAEKLNV